MSAAVLAASALAGCGADRDEARPADAVSAPASPSPTTSPTAPSTTATAGGAAPDSPHTLAELVEQPCLALGDEDTVEFGVIIGPKEVNRDSKACQWYVRDGLVAFTPYPSTDLTTGGDVRHLTRTTIAGHRAVMGTLRGGCRTLVSVGPRESFRLDTSPSRDPTNRKDDRYYASRACELSKRFAAAILANLQ